MNTTRTARRAVGALAFVVGTWTVLVALFAMHGLPMQLPGGMTMPTTASVVVAMSHHDADDSDPLDAAGPTVESQTLTATSQSCEGNDHCTATLRPAHTSALPGVILASTRTAHTFSAPGSSVRPALIARPPDLDTLQISRT